MVNALSTSLEPPRLAESGDFGRLGMNTLRKCVLLLHLLALIAALSFGPNSAGHGLRIVLVFVFVLLGLVLGGLVFLAALLVIGFGVFRVCILHTGRLVDVDLAVFSLSQGSDSALQLLPLAALVVGLLPKPEG